MAGRIATGMAMEFRYKLRMIGVPIDGPPIMFVDNEKHDEKCYVTVQHVTENSQCNCIPSCERSGGSKCDLKCTCWDKERIWKMC